MSPRLSCMLFILLIFAISANAQNSDSPGNSAGDSAGDSSGDSSGDASGESSGSGEGSQSSQQQDEDQNEQENPPEDQQPAPQSETTTKGVVGSVTQYFTPLTSLLYQTLDSILRNVFRVSLPCTIYDFTRLDIECTPLQ